MKSLLIALSSFWALGACSSLSTYEAEKVCVYGELSERSETAQAALEALGFNLPLGSTVMKPVIYGQSSFDMRVQIPSDVQFLELPASGSVFATKPCEADEGLNCIAELSIKGEVIKPGTYTNPEFSFEYKEMAKIRNKMAEPLSEHSAKLANNESIELCQYSSNRTFDRKPLESFN